MSDAETPAPAVPQSALGAQADISDKERRRIELPVRIRVQAIKFVKTYQDAWTAGGGNLTDLNSWRQDPVACPGTTRALFERLSALPQLELTGPVDPTAIDDVEPAIARMWGSTLVLEDKLALRGVTLLPDDDNIRIEHDPTEDDPSRALVVLDLRYRWKDVRAAYELLRSARGIDDRVSPDRRLMWGTPLGRGWQLAFRLLDAERNLSEDERSVHAKNLMLATKVGLLRPTADSTGRRDVGDMVGELVDRARAEVKGIAGPVTARLTPPEFPQLKKR